ncbi:Uncharacterised protein [Edwardsiella tarda]|nr:Uncharacterised protein [Edwardsiella tarda]
MQKEIEFYEEKLLPYLQNIGNSDLSGDVRLYSRENNASGRVTTIDYHSVNEAIDSFIN